jgi:hypothetical protein
VVGGLHAGSPDDKGNADMSEEEIGEEGYGKDPD